VIDRNVPDQPWFRAADPGRRRRGKRAFVTGAGTAPNGDLPGIGEAIAVLFARQGAKVAIADVSAERARTTLRLDTVVNNVALSGGGGSPADVDLEVWERVIAVNLRATMLTARHTIPQLKLAGGGSIINISSIAAARGLGTGAYAASKAAMAGLTRDWAFAHGRDHVRVNCILVGHVHTPMGGGDPAGRERRRLASLPGTEGVAWDIAWPAVFLASDESRWITGVELPVDAGTTATTGLGVRTLNER
jgi:NAD(P)-dependent dehydrogenase (short-subunit alcohol dehydrogenase family)